MDDHGIGVLYLNLLKGAAHRPQARAQVLGIDKVINAKLDILSGEFITVMELDALSQVEGPAQLVGRLLPFMSNARLGGKLAIIGATHQVVVDQELVVLDAGGDLPPRDETLRTQKSQGEAQFSLRFGYRLTLLSKTPRVSMPV